VASEDWGALLVASAVTALWLYVPGALFLRAVRVRGLALAALAPVATVAMLALIGLLLPLGGLPWTIPLVVFGCAVLVALAVLVRTLGVHARALTLPPTDGRLLLAGVIGLQVVLAAVPFVRGMGGPGAILQWWDAMYHYSAMRFVLETQNASMLHVGGVALPGATSSYYPSGWHQLATLTSLSLPPSTDWFRIAYTAACLVPFTVPFALGLAYAARAVFPGRWRAHLAVAVGAATTSVPLSIYGQHGSLPQALTLALLPAAIGGVFALLRRDPPTAPGTGARSVGGEASGDEAPGDEAPGTGSSGTGRPADPFRAPRARVGALLVLGVLSLGLLSAQPSGMFGLWLTVIPLLVLHAVRLGRDGAATAARRRLAWALPAVLVAAGAIATVTPVAQGAVEYDGSLHVGWPEAWRNLLLGWFQSWFTPWNAAVGLLGLAGVALAVRRRHWAFAGAYGLVALFFLDAATFWWPPLSGLWYNDQKRLGVHLSILLLLAAAELLGTLVDRLAARAVTTDEPPEGRRLERVLGPGNDRVRSVTAGALAVVLLGIGAAGIPPRTDLVREDFSNGPGTHVPLVTEEEIAMMADVVPTLDPSGTILGVPVAGTPFFYSLFGYSVEYRVAGGGMFLDQKRTNNTLTDWHGADQPACDSAANLGSTIYLYQDANLYIPEYRIPWVNEVDVPGAVPVATTGAATLYELPRCEAAD
jgi:hypothetical protein